MEAVKNNSVFDQILLPSNSEVLIKNKTLVVSKWNWDYEDCLKFQKEAQKLIQKYRDHKIYIFCNHPHCFTLGRGNERGRDDLVPFQTNVEKELNFPVHKIHRGGGITFHFTGQWIFYPICSINANYTLEDHMCWLLKSVKNVLQENFVSEQLMATKKLMGIWHKRKKLASIGVGVNRFVTEHGLALNITFDEKMKRELVKINPCGMQSEIYTSVSELIENPGKDLLKNFHKAYLEII